jgi:hypothetical protein
MKGLGAEIKWSNKMEGSASAFNRNYLFEGRKFFLEAKINNRS